MAEWKTQRWRCLYTSLHGAVLATPTRPTSLEVKFISQPIRFTEELQPVMWKGLICLMPYQSDSTLSGFSMLSGFEMNLTQSSPSATTTAALQMRLYFFRCLSRININVRLFPRSENKRQKHGLVSFTSLHARNLSFSFIPTWRREKKQTSIDLHNTARFPSVNIEAFLLVQRRWKATKRKWSYWVEPTLTEVLSPTWEGYEGYISFYRDITQGSGTTCFNIHSL